MPSPFDYQLQLEGRFGNGQHNLEEYYKDTLSAYGIDPQTFNFPFQEENNSLPSDAINNPIPDPNLVKAIKSQSVQSQEQVPQQPIQPVETQTTPTATVTTQPETPPTSEEIADKAMNDAVKQEQLDFAAKRAAEGIADESYPLIAQIVKFQNDWQAANSKGDAEGMKAAHDGAEGVRRIAKVRGIDLGQWDNGGNFSAEQSNFALYNYGLDKLQERQDKFKSVQDDLKNRYALSSQQYYDDRLDYYRSRGVPYGEAVIRAGRETLSYQKDRTGFLQDAIDTFGIDNGTTMNQFGISALGQLATEDNIMGSAYANAYAKPLNEYNYNNAMQQLMATQAAAMQRQNARNQYDWTKTQYTQGQINERNKLDNEVRKYNGDKNRENQRNIAQYQQEQANARKQADIWQRQNEEEGRNRRFFAKNGGKNVKLKPQVELDKRYADIKKAFDEYKEKHGVEDSENPYYDAVVSARDLKNHRFEGDTNTPEGMWGHATDWAEVYIERNGYKPFWEDFVKIMRENYPNNPYVEGILKKIQDQKNDHINWSKKPE